MYNQFKDEVIVGLPKYNVTNNADGTKSIELANTVTEQGTPLNRATFANLQGDIYTETKYNTPTYSGNAMTLNLPLTSYETDKIVRIKSPTTFTEHPTININQLGAKTVNAVLAQGLCYDLVYNGTSFDVSISNGGGIDKYYPISSTAETIIGNPVPTTGWAGSEREYTNGDFKLSCTSVTSGHTLTDILQNNNDYSLTEEIFEVDVIITLDRPLKLTKFKLYVYHDHTSSSLRRYIYGSNNLQDWDLLYSESSTTYTESEVTLSNPSEYKYYKLNLYHSNQGYRFRIYKFFPTEYEQQKATLNIPISSYEEDMIVRIKSDANLTYPLININNLGDKQINGDLAQNNYYDLIYNGSSFDIANKKNYVLAESGTYTIEDGLYYVEMCGGGGGGSYSGTGSSKYSGGPGAVAGFIQELGGNITVVIGAGGARGYSSTHYQGGAGGDTSINGINIVSKGGQAFGGRGAGGLVTTSTRPVFKLDGYEENTGTARNVGLEYKGIIYGKEGTGGSSSDVTTAGTQGVIILHKI